MTLAVVPLAQALSASPTAASWTVTAYALAVSAALLPAGALADRCGSLRVFRIGVAVFAAASILCAGVWSMPMLIGARVIQGLAAALIQSTAPALIAGLSPPRRQAAGYGWLSVAAGLGVILGPPVAGLLLTIDGWRLLFLINLPFFAGLAIMLGSVLGLAALGVAALAPTYGLLVLFGLGSGLFQPAGFASALATASPQERARVGALVRFATNLGIATGGWVSAAAGARPWIAAGILLVTAAALAARLLGPTGQPATQRR